MNAEHDTDRETVVESSGNVFHDLGISMSDEDMLKISIARAINSTIAKRELTQTEAAKLMDADQSKVSALLCGRLRQFSVERLMRYLVLLGRDIDIHISKRYRNEKGRIKVMAA